MGVVFVAGDFNTTIESNKENADRKADTSKKTLQNFVDSMKLTETWKFAQDQNGRFSREAPDGRETQIDYISVEDSLEEHIISMDRKVSIG